MFENFKQVETAELLKQIHSVIKEYELTKHNKEGYNRLREEYNRTQSPLLLFLLCCYGFNHQIRFNNKGEFNNPFGINRSSYNANIERNLCRTLQRIRNFDFLTCNFRDISLAFMQPGDFLYADPPYLISCGSYNDGKRGFAGWSEKDDGMLFEKLDALTEREIKFAMSNVILHKGKTNEGLLRWAQKYNIHYLNADYSNSNYQAVASKTKEVLITNY